MLKRAAVALAAAATLATGALPANAAPAVLPAATTPAPGGMSQWGGADLYATAILTSQKTFQPGVDMVVVATGASYTDGLAGAAVAANANGPVLLTASTTMRSDIRAELARLKPGAVMITGGTGAVSSTVESQIRATVPNAYVMRAGGASVYDTAALISATYYADGAQTVFIASATSAADATTAASPAGLTAGPLLLTGGSTLPTATRNELVRLKSKGLLENVVIVGGPGAIPNSVFSAVDSIMGRDAAGYPRTVRVWGQSLYDTSASMARLLWDGANAPAATTVFYANGTRWGDALAAGPAAAANDAPVVHTTKSCMPGPIKTWDTQNSGTLKARVFIGGSAVITPTTTAC